MPDFVIGTPRLATFSYFAFESLTVGIVGIQGVASRGLTQATWAPTARTNQPSAQVALLTIETNSIRFHVDGGNADGSGHLATTSDTITLYGQDAIRNFRALGVSDNATIRVSYGR
mgnify:FL=1